MRVRQKLTAVGACALATTAVLGGAVVTSHAMGESPTPGKGTVTVISMTSDSDGAIKCVYDDIDLPTPPIGAGTGAVMVSTGSVASPDGKAPDNPPTFTVNSGAAGDPALPPIPDGAVVLNSDDARPGTAEECAALKPTTSGLPAQPTAP